MEGYSLVDIYWTRVPDGYGCHLGGASDAPQVLICASLPGDMAHDGLDRQCVR
jgi:hypothetical protein